VWQVCSKDYTYIKVKVLSIPIIACYDYDGEALSNLQANNFTNCFGEYLSTFGFESVIKLIAYTLKISTRFL
jgi:hypothetical protein